VAVKHPLEPMLVAIDEGGELTGFVSLALILVHPRLPSTHSFIQGAARRCITLTHTDDPSRSCHP